MSHYLIAVTAIRAWWGVAEKSECVTVHYPCIAYVIAGADMAEPATFTFRVEEELKAQFTQAAKASDRTGAQLLRDFMRDFVKRQAAQTPHDVWFRGKVQAALDKPDPVFHDFADVFDDLERHAAELTARRGRA